jgi:hypothetical protein
LRGALAALVLLVGGGPAEAANARYMISGTTVLDTKTNLTWQQTLSGMAYTWLGAKSYCSGMGTGWRWPTLKELQSLVDYSKSTAPILDLGAFPGTPSSASPFWSSTAVAGSSSDAWGVNFQTGNSAYADKMTSFYVRCVR